MGRSFCLIKYGTKTSRHLTILLICTSQGTKPSRPFEILCDPEPPTMKSGYRAFRAYILHRSKAEQFFKISEVKLNSSQQVVYASLSEPSRRPARISYQTRSRGIRQMLSPFGVLKETGFWGRMPGEFDVQCSVRPMPFNGRIIQQKTGPDCKPLVNLTKGPESRRWSAAEGE